MSSTLAKFFAGFVSFLVLVFLISRIFPDAPGIRQVTQPDTSPRAQSRAFVLPDTQTNRGSNDETSPAHNRFPEVEIEPATEAAEVGNVDIGSHLNVEDHYHGPNITAARENIGPDMDVENPARQSEDQHEVINIGLNLNADDATSTAEILPQSNVNIGENIDINIAEDWFSETDESRNIGPEVQVDHLL